MTTTIPIVGNNVVYISKHNGGLVSVLTLEGERLAQWGDPSFSSCHSIWGDSRGDLYVVRPGAWGRVRRVVKYVRLYRPRTSAKRSPASVSPTSRTRPRNNLYP